MAADQLVVAIIGPSASGKSSVVRCLHLRGVVRVNPTWTTRPRRDDEQAGSLEHRFVTEATFDTLERDGFFVQTTTMFGLPFRYGIPPLRSSGDESVELMMVRAPLVEGVRALVPGLVVYQIEDDPIRSQQRLIQRSTGAADIAARLRGNRAELAAGRLVADRRFTNDGTIDDLADRIAAALADDRVAGRAPSMAGAR